MRLLFALSVERNRALQAVHVPPRWEELFPRPPGRRRFHRHGSPASEKPIVVGHSIAGEELSSLASRCPSRISGLIYLGACYPHTCYDSSRGDVDLDAFEGRRKIDQLLPGSVVPPLTATKQLLDELPRLQKDLEKQQTDLSALATPPGSDLGVRRRVYLLVTIAVAK